MLRLKAEEHKERRVSESPNDVSAIDEDTEEEKLLAEAVITLDGTTDLLALDTLESLGNLYYTTGKLLQAEKLHTLCLRGRQEALGESHNDTLKCMNTLAALYVANEKYDEASRLLENCLHIGEEVLGREHTDVRITALNLYDVYTLLGRDQDSQRIEKHYSIQKEDRKRVQSNHNKNTILDDMKGKNQNEFTVEDSELLLTNDDSTFVSSLDDEIENNGNALLIDSSSLELSILPPEPPR